jgi:hypothetical protein
MAGERRGRCSCEFAAVENDKVDASGVFFVAAPDGEFEYVTLSADPVVELEVVSESAAGRCEMETVRSVEPHVGSAAQDLPAKMATCANAMEKPSTSEIRSRINASLHLRVYSPSI